MFDGSLVALVTPMKEDGALDWDALCGLVEFHVRGGTRAIVAVGTTGESATLDMAEHAEVIRRTVEAAAGRVPVIAGTGANSTSEALELTVAAKAAGAEACLLVTPYYNRPTQEGLFRHFRLLAESVAIPQILYNVPGRTGCDLLPETAARLARVPGIIGIKEASGKVERVTSLRTLCGESFVVWSGDDALAVESMRRGARGVISVTANVVPDQVQKVCAAALAGDCATAERLDAPLADLHRDLFIESNPIPVKWALAAMGLIGPGIRLPLTPLDPAMHGAVRRALANAGVRI